MRRCVHLRTSRLCQSHQCPWGWVIRNWVPTISYLNIQYLYDAELVISILHYPFAELKEVVHRLFVWELESIRGVLIIGLISAYLMYDLFEFVNEGIITLLGRLWLLYMLIYVQYLMEELYPFFFELDLDILLSDVNTEHVTAVCHHLPQVCGVKHNVI